MSTAGVVVTVTLGAWSQTWTVPEVTGDADDATIELVSDQGAVLDGIGANWTSEGWLSQPTAAVASLSVYVPETATDRPDLTGRGRVTILPPDYDPDDDYDPLLDIEGRVTDGDAVPLRDGLAYAVTITDHREELGESMLGGLTWQIETLWERMQTLTRRLRRVGIRWDAGQVPETIDTTKPFAGIDTTKFWVISRMTAYYLAPPAFRKVTTEPTASGEVLDGHLSALIRWSHARSVMSDVNDYRLLGVHEWQTYLDEPPATSESVAYFRPIVVPHVTPLGRREIRTTWQSTHKPGEVGRPMALDAAGQIVFRGDEGVVPQTSRYGTWIPASAVERSSITWRVDKERHPNAIRLSGWWKDYAYPWDFQFWRSSSDVTMEWFHETADYGRTEKQLEYPFLQDEDEPELAFNPPEYIAHAHAGFTIDRVPRYAVDSITVIPEAIPDSRAWPRLFDDPSMDTWTWWGGCAASRLMFVYGMPAKWHPEGRTRTHGYLTGAELTLQGGKLRMVAHMIERRPGPNEIPPEFLVSETGEWVDPTVDDFTQPLVKAVDLDEAVTAETIDPTYNALDAWLTGAA